MNHEHKPNTDYNKDAYEHLRQHRCICGNPMYLSHAIGNKFFYYCSPGYDEKVNVPIITGEWSEIILSLPTSGGGANAASTQKIKKESDIK